MNTQFFNVLFNSFVNFDPNCRDDMYRNKQFKVQQSMTRIYNLFECLADAGKEEMRLRFIMDKFAK